MEKVKSRYTGAFSYGQLPGGVEGFNTGAGLKAFKFISALAQDW